MKIKTKHNIFYVFPAVLLVSACMCTSSIPGINPTVTPVPSDAPTVVPTTPTATAPPVTSEPTEELTVAPGSFDDFRLLAAELAAAVQAKDTSFFGEYAAPSTWTCLGDETFGVCKDLPPDATMEGIPVAYDWERYELPGKEDYTARWESTFTDRKVVKLVALGNKFGENPLMPMASQSFLAIIGIGDDPASLWEAQVLFFEYAVNVWHLRGELVTTENAEAWLNNTCSMCYDTWEAWQE
jgi:hypothetical protein